MQRIKDYHFDLEFFSRLAEKCQLSEAQRRMMAGMVANEIGWGGTSAVSDALSLRRQSVRRGQKEATGQLQSPMVRGRERAEGGGRPKLVDKDPDLVQRITSFFTFYSANCRYLCFYSER